MTESVARRGRDTFVNSDKPNTPFGDSRFVWLRSGVKRGLLYIPLPSDILGKTVESAILTAHAGAAWDPQTLTFAPLAEGFAAAEETWKSQPATRAGTATVTTGAKSVGGEIVADIKPLVQQVADGAPHFGWRVSTSATSNQKLYSFNSGKASWTLTVVLSEEPEAPTGLVPNGGVVSTSAPTLTFTAADLTALQVRLDPAADEVTPAFDSGTVPATTTAYALAEHAYPALAPGGSDQWQVRALIGGVWSPWSDWAPFTYRPLPTLTLDSPAGGVLWDPTSDVLAHIGGTNLDAYRVRITSGTDRTKVLHDSEKKPATDPSNIAYGLPEKNRDGSRIFVDDRDYQLNVRAFDDYVRQDTPGGKSYAELWTTIHFDDDLALTPVSTLHAAQIGETPGVRLTWTRAAAADAWVIVRDGAVIGRLDPADTVVGTSTYSWVDLTAAPNEQHVYVVHAIANGTRSAGSPTRTITPEVEGMWLIREDGDSVRLDGDGVGGFRTNERRASYKPLRVPYEVDIITGFEGISGDFEGTVEEEPDQAFHDAEAVLDAIKDNPTESVRMVYTRVSVPVSVKQMTCLPASDFTIENLRHKVNFSVSQIGEFRHGVN